VVRRVFDPIGVAAREAAKQSSEQVWATSEFQLGERETLPSELLTDNGSGRRGDTDSPCPPLDGLAPPWRASCGEANN
jgi:hypothetical protein